MQKETSTIQISILDIASILYRTAQWCNAAILQFDRVLEDNQNLESDLFELGNAKFGLNMADIKFFIIAVAQYIKYLEKLTYLLKGFDAKKAKRIARIFESVATDDQRKEIRSWRNINEHELEYLQHIGNEQKSPRDYLNNGWVGVSECGLCILSYKDEIPIFKVGQIDQRGFFINSYWPNLEKKLIFKIGRIDMIDLMKKIKASRGPIFKEANDFYKYYVEGIQGKNKVVQYAYKNGRLIREVFLR